MNYGHPTTEVFARTARQSGTEYAASGEKMRRRRDWSGIAIVVVMALITASPYIVIAWTMP